MRAEHLLDRGFRNFAMLTRSDPSHILIPPQGLIVRESTDFYSVEDKLVASALAFIAANSHRPISQDETKTKYPPPPRSRAASHTQPGHHYQHRAVKSARRLLSYLTAVCTPLRIVADAIGMVSG